MPRLFLAISILVSFFTPVASRADTGLTPFPDGTKYLAVGDSITHAGRYPLYLDLFYATRFPKATVKVVNCGISGDTAGGAINRFSWDIAPKCPGIASVMFGMNDVGRDLYQTNSPDMLAQREQRIDDYEKALRTLVDFLQKAGAQVIVFTPSIYDDTSTMAAPNLPGLDLGLEECAKRAVHVAADLHLPVVDFYHPLLAINQAEQAKNPTFTITGPDRIHPMAPGHLVMTYLFLKAQQAPGEVAFLAVDAKGAAVTLSRNCQVEKVETKEGGVAFSYTANALPFPIEDEARPALDWVPWVKDFNQEIVQVAHLAPGNYDLKIDGQRIRSYSAEELSQGVNLAVETTTPQYVQARNVLALCVQRWQLIWKLRDIALVEIGAAQNSPRPLTLAQVQPLLDARLKQALGKPWESYIRMTGEHYVSDKPHEQEFATQAEELGRKMKEAAQPQPHQIEITPLH